LHYPTLALLYGPLPQNLWVAGGKQEKGTDLFFGGRITDMTTTFRAVASSPSGMAAFIRTNGRRDP
jgi:hypothetical protein